MSHSGAGKDVFVGGGKDSGVSQALDEIEELVNDDDVWKHVDAIADQHEAHSRQASEAFNHAKKLMQSLNQLESLQAAYVPVDSALPLDRRIHNFAKWVAKFADIHFGSRATPMIVASIPGKGLGTKATEKLKPGERILQVPQSIMMSTKTALESPWGEMIRKDSQLQSMPEVSLAVHLLLEAAKANEATDPAEDAIQDSLFDPTDPAGSDSVDLTRGSFWRTYLAILPPTCPNILKFQGSHMDMLRYSGKIGRQLLLTSIKTIRSTLKAYLTLYRRYVPEKKEKGCNKGTSRKNCLVPGLTRSNFSWAGFRWAVCMVMSRQNKVPLPGFSGDINALVPVWDLLNHENLVHAGITTTAEIKNEQCVLLHHAPREFEENEELTMYYGDRDNFSFLKYSGFSVRNNPNEKITIHFPLFDSSSDELRKVRALLLKNLGYVTEKLDQNQNHISLDIAPSTKENCSVPDLHKVFIEDTLLVAKLCFGDKDTLDAILREGRKERCNISRSISEEVANKLLETTKSYLDLDEEYTPVSAALSESAFSVEGVIERGECVYSSGDVTTTIWQYLDERRRVHEQFWSILTQLVEKNTVQEGPGT